MSTTACTIPSVRPGTKTTAVIERTTWTLTVVIDGQPIVSKFKGRGFTCLVENPAMLADAFRALVEVD
ncbi:hypothetical protein [Haliea sp. E17]|uniref:hypothetical protein n=1 Tax=Haliea sp. E17 TaxID=3401576 RepID=UPI003AADECE3